MPNGADRPLAKTTFFASFPSSPGRRMRIRPAEVSAMKRSPLGAARMIRGSDSPSAKSSTVNPSGAFGFAPAGRPVSRGGLLAERVS